VWPGAVEVVRGDVTDPVSLPPATRGAATVVHLAAVVSDWGREETFRRVTVEGTENVLGLVDPGTRVLLVSSVVVYGDSVGKDLCDEDHPFGRPLGPYSRSKQAQERLAWDLARERGFELTVVRPTNVYGPGSKPWVHEVVALLRRRRPVLVGAGDGNAALCHVDNLIDLLLRAASAPQAVGRAYNASDGSDVTWRRYFTDLARIAGTEPPRSISRFLARLGAAAAEAIWGTLRISSRPPLTREALNLVGSNLRIPIERARRDLEYAPTVAYEEGLATVASYLGAAS
jgi:nucleoside-diphosphate-sugar epimerase